MAQVSGMSELHNNGSERDSRVGESRFGRNSPLWDEMVLRFGKEKAVRLLREFRAEKR